MGQCSRAYVEESIHVFAASCRAIVGDEVIEKPNSGNEIACCHGVYYLINTC